MKVIEESDKGYFLQVDAQYLENIRNPYNDVPFLSERMKLKKLKSL